MNALQILGEAWQSPDGQTFWVAGCNVEDQTVTFDGRHWISYPPEGWTCLNPPDAP